MTAAVEPSHSPTPSAPSRDWAPGVFLGLLALIAALNLAVFVVRLQSVVTSGHLADTSGIEGPGIYNIWKLQHGYPLYEDPTQPPYTVTLYNFLFYHTYAKLATWLGCQDAALQAGTKFFTLGFAFIGLVAEGLLLQGLLPRDTFSRSAAWLMAFIVWYGTGLTSWMAMSARPDVPAAAFACCGLAILTRSRRPVSGALAASLVFFVAWGFKQVFVWSLAGASLHCLLTRQWKRAAALILPCGALMLASLALGGANYRWNLIFAPSLNPLLPGAAARQFAEIFGKNAFIWLFALLGGYTYTTPLRRRPAQASSAPPDGRAAQADSRRMLALVFAVATLCGLVTLSKEGSGPIHMLEAYVAASILATCVLADLVRHPSGRQQALTSAAIVLLLLLALLPAAQLVFPDRIGVQHLLDAQTTRERESLAVLMQRLPKPIFTKYGEFLQPWHATGNKYPATIIDEYFYNRALDHGLLHGKGLPGMFQDRWFAAVVLPADDPLYTTALAAGYRPVKVSELLPQGWGVLLAPAK